MSNHGWATDSTWGVAAACDNTEAFHNEELPPILALARAGDTDGAAAQLQTAVTENRSLGGNLASWVDLSAVDWRQLVTVWVTDDE